MSELPYIGCAITIVDPGPVKQGRNAIYAPRRYRNGELRLMKAYVERVETKHWDSNPVVVYWRAGKRQGSVLAQDEGVEWVRGHGPMAQASLRATRKLVHS